FIPIKCMLCGGPVVITTSTLFSFIYSFKYRTDGFTHKTRASGINRLPRIHKLKRSGHDCRFLSGIIPALILSILFLDKTDAIPYGSMMGREMISTLGTSFLSASSTMG